MKRIAIINQKGGVGKTTTAVNLACALANMGYRVGLIDFDPQGNATKCMGVEVEAEDLTISDVLINFSNIKDTFILSKKVFVVPAIDDLKNADVQTYNLPDRYYRLEHALDNLDDEVLDYLFVDCNPELGFFSLNAMCACPYILCPVQTEHLAIDGMVELFKKLPEVESKLNRKTKIWGVLFTMNDNRTRLHKEVMARIRNQFGSKVFETIINRNIDLGDAPGYGLDIFSYKPQSRGAKDYQDLADEFIRRINDGKKTKRKATTKRPA